MYTMNNQGNISASILTSACSSFFFSRTKSEFSTVGFCLELCTYHTLPVPEKGVVILYYFSITGPPWKFQAQLPCTTKDIRHAKSTLNRDMDLSPVLFRNIGHVVSYFPILLLDVRLVNSIALNMDS